MEGGSEIYHPPRLAMILGERTFQRLLALRRELSALINLPLGPDIGVEVPISAIGFRSASDRYDGKMYKAANFRRTFAGFRGQALIVSALYGLLDAEDHIRYYDLAMNDRLPTGESVWHWWKRNGLRMYVETALKNIETTEVHDLLSGLYRKALGSLNSDSQYMVKTYRYPNQGSASLYRRGEGINRLLIGS